jgi:hypothetical protein
MAITRDMQRARWQNKGIRSGPAMDALTELGTAERRASREAAVQEVLGQYDEPGVRQLLLAMEHFGVGGPGPWGDGSSGVRHPAFRRLGKGRRYASDGPAWTAAIANCRRRVRLEAGEGEILVTVCDGETVGIELDALYYVEGQPTDTVPFVSALIGECLLVALAESRPMRTPSNLEVIGEPAAWAQLYDEVARYRDATEAMEAWAATASTDEPHGSRGTIDVAADACGAASADAPEYVPTSVFCEDAFLTWAHTDYPEICPPHWVGITSTGYVVRARWKWHLQALDVHWRAFHLFAPGPPAPAIGGSTAQQ